MKPEGSRPSRASVPNLPEGNNMHKEIIIKLFGDEVEHFDARFDSARKIAESVTRYLSTYGCTVTVETLSVKN